MKPNSLTQLLLLATTLLAFTFTTPTSLASEEEFVPLASITLKSQPNDHAGTVILDATQHPDGTWQKLTLTAFGKTHTLPPAQLAHLQDFPLTGISLRQEAGYPQLGGHTVHVRLERTRHDPASNKSIREALYLSLAKDTGKLAIAAPRTIQH
ncbi:hypothetical protein OKA05_27360 [Luteolibacter arcticus]|uniref:Uncharacterized protein n=1 Tax=Luteolibacter arcticus TaxID=1581411 RepID=A0ABT3GS24_9BACT|nr:hypothetical protein [Luteolibacter arcticus]MCW1926303.1 hypothetical protein [Luteolibacter arcticus]